MSVSRDVIADVLSIPEEQVRCDNCRYADKWINDSYSCKLWAGQQTFAKQFCSFFKMREEQE